MIPRRGEPRIALDRILGMTGGHIEGFADEECL